MVQNTRDAPRSEIIPVPTGFTPEGVKVSVLDPATLALVEQAIPPNLGGQDLLVHLLCYATLSPKMTMQHNLFKETGESGDEAIILITRVDDLARSQGSRWSVETYHKVLLVLEALKVIRRRFHRSYTEIRVPLGKRAIHIPQLLADLRHLHDTYTNRKARLFARKVALRLEAEEFVARMGTLSAGNATEQAPLSQTLVPVDTHQSKRYNCVPACVSCNSAKGDRHPGMLSPSSWIAGTLPSVQNYLKTHETAREVDS